MVTNDQTWNCGVTSDNVNPISKMNLFVICFTGSFYKRTKIALIININANIIFLNICSFILYLYNMLSLDVKWDISGHNRIVFQGCRLHWSS